jgi:hypothetical protein
VNLVRLGHYYIPNGTDDTGSCQTAIVVGVLENHKINLIVWSHEGAVVVRKNIRVEAAPLESHPSFHLSGDCPWGR